jgi:hypothetical protein
MKIKMNLFSFAQQNMNNFPFLTADVKEFLTNSVNHEYKSTVNPPGSFGERVRSRLERGGSCFFRGRR